MANAGHHPTMATFPPGRPDFGYLTLKRCPTIIRHCLKMAGLFDHIGPTAHHVPSEFHPSSSLCYRRRRTRTICLMSIIWFSRPQTTASSPSLQPKVTPQRSSSTEIMSDATTLLSNKCYPDIILVRVQNQIMDIKQMVLVRRR